MKKSKTTAAPTGLPMARWGPGVTHWQAGDRFYAVMVDTATDGTLPKFLTGVMAEIESFAELGVASHQILPRPTALVRCDAAGVAIDADTSTPAIELLTEFRFPAGTSAEDALIAAGYSIAKGTA